MNYSFMENVNDIENLPNIAVHETNKNPIKIALIKFVKKFRYGLVVIILGSVLTGAGWWFYTKQFPASDKKTYQAVFLTNGQAYFGKLENISLDYVKLSNIYYLQVPGLQSNDGSEAEKTQKAELIRLGGEVHGPKNYMYIPKRQILFWEDLDPSSKISQVIDSSI